MGHVNAQLALVGLLLVCGCARDKSPNKPEVPRSLPSVASTPVGPITRSAASAGNPGTSNSPRDDGSKKPAAVKTPSREVKPRIPRAGRYQTYIESSGPFSAGSRNSYFRISRLGDARFEFEEPQGFANDHREFLVSEQGLFETVTLRWNRDKKEWDECVHEQPKKIIPYPAIVGDKWSQPTNCEGYDEGEVLGFDIVEVGSSRVEAIVAKSTHRDRSKTQYELFWYSPSKGLVVRREWVLDENNDKLDARRITRILNLEPEEE